MADDWAPYHYGDWFGLIRGDRAGSMTRRGHLRHSTTGRGPHVSVDWGWMPGPLGNRVLAVT